MCANVKMMFYIKSALMDCHYNGENVREFQRFYKYVQIKRMSGNVNNGLNERKLNNCSILG